MKPITTRSATEQETFDRIRNRVTTDMLTREEMAVVGWMASEQIQKRRSRYKDFLEQQQRDAVTS